MRFCRTICSSPDVYIRELLQNDADVIVVRQMKDTSYDENRGGRIKIMLQEEKLLVFEYNGIGLTKEEIHQFLAIIG